MSEKEAYIFLQTLDEKTNGKLTDALNAHNGASATVCPCCRIDDFVHVEGCKLLGAQDPSIANCVIA